jgi:hypothetical protein
MVPVVVVIITVSVTGRHGGQLSSTCSIAQDGVLFK